MSENISPPPASALSYEQEEAVKTEEGRRSRLDELREVFEKYDAESTSDEARDQIVSDLEEQPLSVGYKITLQIELSCGGPSDGFKLDYEPDSGEVTGGVYYRANWWTYHEVRLTDQECDLVRRAYLSGDPSVLLGR